MGLRSVRVPGLSLGISENANWEPRNCNSLDLWWALKVCIFKAKKVILVSIHASEVWIQTLSSYHTLKINFINLINFMDYVYLFICFISKTTSEYLNIMRYLIIFYKNFYWLMLYKNEVYMLLVISFVKWNTNVCHSKKCLL